MADILYILFYLGIQGCGLYEDCSTHSALYDQKYRKAWCANTQPIVLKENNTFNSHIMIMLQANITESLTKSVTYLSTALFDTFGQEGQCVPLEKVKEIRTLLMNSFLKEGTFEKYPSPFSLSS